MIRDIREMRGLGALLVALVVLLASVRSAQAAGTLSLSPGSGSFGQGSIFVVSVNVDTGGDVVNAVEATLTFPADKLKANYVSHSGSAFDVNAESTVGNGVVRIAKGKLPPGVSGARKVASVGFTATGQGTASISLSGVVLREADSANIIAGENGATFNIGAAAAVITTPGASPAASAAQIADTQAPEISDIRVLNLGIATATISWKTNEPADSQVEYGFVENRASEQINYFLTADDEDALVDHQLELEPKKLISGYLYHFKVSSTDKAGNMAASSDQTFIVPGYPLEIEVTEVDSRKVSGARVSLLGLGVEGITGDDGKVRFSDLPVGTFRVFVQEQDRFKEASVNLVSSHDNRLTLVLDQKVSRPLVSVGVLWAIGLVAIAVIVVGIWYWKKKVNLPPTGGKPKASQLASETSK